MSQSIPTAEIQKAVLQDPRVKEAIANAGKQAVDSGINALSDPEVQKTIMATCQEKFPEYAAATQQMVLKWANDPEVQQRAYEVAGIAGEYAYKPVEAVASLIAQGPTGVRILAFLAGVASCEKACMSLFEVLTDPLSAVTKMIVYLLAVYQIGFAIATMLFEAKPEWIAQVPGLNSLQNTLLEKAKFLSEALGRGLFYGFQGSLWLVWIDIWHIFEQLFELVLGLWFVFVAFLHIAMHFGVMPQTIAAKMRDVRDLGYVPGSQDKLTSRDKLESGEEDPKPTATIEEPAAAPAKESSAPASTEQKPADEQKVPLTSKEEQPPKKSCCTLM